MKGLRPELNNWGEEPQASKRQASDHAKLPTRSQDLSTCAPVPSGATMRHGHRASVPTNNCAACVRASWPLAGLSHAPREWQSLDVASESTNVSFALVDTACRGHTHLLSGGMAWACARTLAATAGPMEPPVHTSEPRCTYDRSRCTTQAVPWMAILLP